MIAKFVFAYPTIEDGEESSEFEKQKVIELETVSDLIKVLQDYVKDHPDAEFDGSCGQLSLVEWHDNNTSHWLDIEQD